MKIIEVYPTHGHVFVDIDLDYNDPKPTIIRLFYEGKYKYYIFITEWKETEIK